MSKQYDNTNRGAMFKNNDKRDDRSPDYRGTLDVDGNEYWISGWIKTAGAAAKNPGAKFLSVSIQPKDESKETKRTGIVDDIEDIDIPF